MVTPINLATGQPVAPEERESLRTRERASLPVATRRSGRNSARAPGTIVIHGQVNESVISSIASPTQPPQTQPPETQPPQTQTSVTTPTLPEGETNKSIDEYGIEEGGDSDVDGEDFEVHHNGVVQEDEREDDAVEVDNLDMRGKFKSYVDLTETGGMDVVGQISLSGDEDSAKVKLPKVPEDWSAPAVQRDRGEPSFECVDNPGGWDSYVFKPVFGGRSKTTKYKHHALPTGAIPVPKDDNGVRSENGWEFHYKGWKNENSPYRRGATPTNMFPKEMNGCLDASLLTKLGLTKMRMDDQDALFFINLSYLFVTQPSRGLKEIHEQHITPSAKGLRTWAKLNQDVADRTDTPGNPLLHQNCSSLMAF